MYLSTQYLVNHNQINYYHSVQKDFHSAFVYRGKYEEYKW